ncbi:class I SAM-dependent methyltransferase [Singulisphaera sp. PoT]|uniref:class I SAM-dependent methyltransferase n=1 Tax=Singulisphaera sp. PoT TaxID=3411797 RepID=UPI003BF60C34
MTPTRIDSALDRIYAARFSEGERRAKARLWKTLYRSFFRRYIPADGTVLDVGAGYCDFINQVEARRRIAVDLNPDTVRTADAGVEVFTLTLERMGDVIAPESVDLAFASNVFEHFRGPDTLLEVLQAIRQILKPGGRLIIMQPNVRWVGGAFWDYVDHTLPLTEKGMVEACKMSGFEILECRSRFLPYTTKSWYPQWLPLIRLYLALRPAQWLLGKQMLLVTRRPRRRQEPTSPPRSTS